VLLPSGTGQDAGMAIQNPRVARDGKKCYTIRVCQEVAAKEKKGTFDEEPGR